MGQMTELTVSKQIPETG